MELIGKTDMGKMRETNQDSFATGTLQENCSLLLVCDGMGGQKGGNVASQMTRDAVISTLAQELKLPITEGEMRCLMEKAVTRANDLVYQKAQKDPSLEGMGTTLVLAVILDDVAYVTHVGDSRAYLFSQNTLYQLTKDHSFVQMLIEKGEITVTQAKDHPRKNQITRAVGVMKQVNVEYHNWHLKPNDRLLLCTDGLTNTCNHDEIAKLLKKKDLERVTEDLISQANQRGGEDNITVVLGQV